jgi:Ca2+-binding EF-hand superfamily protein
MGADESLPAPATEPADSEYSSLSSETRFDIAALKVLYRKYRAIADSLIADRVIDLQEFQAALGITNLEFARHIFRAFDSDGSLRIDFPEFVRGLDAMAPGATIEQRAAFCFRVYDIDKNGYIDANELREIATLSIGDPGKHHDVLIQRTFERIDANRDGKVTYDEFINAVRTVPFILACVSVNIDSLLKL